MAIPALPSRPPCRPWAKIPAKRPASRCPAPPSSQPPPKKRHQTCGFPEAPFLISKLKYDMYQHFLRPISVFSLWCLALGSASAQIEFKLQWMPDSLAWGIFARPTDGTNPSDYLIIGSGQATVVAPNGAQFTRLQSFSGTWEQNAYVNAPAENPEMDYISFGLVTADPPIPLTAGKETLLFTFANKSETCPETLYLMENKDPFNRMPNSVNSNPGNDISILDPGQDKSVYQFTAVYAPQAWDCHPGKGVEQGPFQTGQSRLKLRRTNRP